MPMTGNPSSQDQVAHLERRREGQAAHFIVLSVFETASPLCVPLHPGVTPAAYTTTQVPR